MFLFLKNIFGDVSLLYKNFIHWNISKILSYVFALLLGILLSLPFLVALCALVYFDPIDWNDIVGTFYATNSFGLSFLTAISNYYIYIIIEFVLLSIAVGFFSFGYSYYLISLSNFYIGYLNGKKLPYFSKIFFDFKNIFNYIGILIWGSLIFLIPLFLFVLSVTFTLFSLGGVESVFETYKESSISLFSIITGIIALICFLIFLYLSYRVSFSYLILLNGNFSFDEEKFSQKKSINISIISVHVIIFIIFLAILYFSPIYGAFIYVGILLFVLLLISTIILIRSRKYLYYIIESFKITSGVKIFKFLLVVIIYSIVMVLFQILSSVVESFGIAGSYLMWIINLLIFSGIFEMIFVSSYKNIMLNFENIALREEYDTKEEEIYVSKSEYINNLKENDNLENDNK